MRTELKKDEKLILVTKEHWFSLILSFISSFFLLILISLIFRLLEISGVLVLLIFILLIIYFIIEREKNLWVVTNLRVIQEFGVFSSNSKESPLDKINNVSYRQSLLGNIFGYGIVQIQTAAEKGSTTKIMSEKSKELKDAITQMMEEYKHHQIEDQSTELAKAISTGQQNIITDVASELEKLYELKQKGIITEEDYNNRKTKILNS